MQAAGDSGLRQAIEAADDARFRAKAACDWDALERLLADDLVYVHGNGHTDSKASLLASLATRRVHYLGAARRDTTLRRFGELAMLSGRITLRYELGGQERAGDSTFLSAWVLRGGRWQLVHWHSANLPA